MILLEFLEHFHLCMNKKNLPNAIMFFAVCIVILQIVGCTILKTNRYIQAKKLRGKFEMRLFTSAPTFTLGKHGYFNIRCGKMLEHTQCYGRYIQKGSFIFIKTINSNCNCIYSDTLILKDSLLYEIKGNGSIVNSWHLY